MIARRKLLATGALLPLVLVGCGGKKASGSEPPSIKLGRDSCDRCGMIISEERFASGIVDEKGNATIFDDPGEMVASVQAEGSTGRSVWVHGYPSMKWLDANDAVYVVAKEAQTPMGTGVVPFDNDSEALTFAEEKEGSVYTWEELLQNWRLESMMGAKHE
jgi:copper chaperone NosL